MKSLGLFTLLFCSGILIVLTTCVQSSLAEEEAGGEDFLVSAPDGGTVGCGDCGERCNNMCGSRRFRLCCLHYMRRKKKRSEAEAAGMRVLLGGNTHFPSIKSAPEKTFDPRPLHPFHYYEEDEQFPTEY